MKYEKTYFGFVGIVGRTNVGKSTLLNNLVGKKISITSRRKKTTRCCIFGINTEGAYQTIYIDTPGIDTKSKYNINNFIMSPKKKSNVICSIEFVIFVIEATGWTNSDEEVLRKLQSNKIRVILVVNKIDQLQKKTDLLPYLDWLSKKMDFLDIVPVSAKTGLNLDMISGITRQYLLEGMHQFPEEWDTDSSERFIASEIIREKLMRFFCAEIPYCVTIKIERFQVDEYFGYDIYAVIFVNRHGQKKIIIGKGGEKIQTITITARKDIQKIFEAPVHLKLWVKLRPR